MPTGTRKLTPALDAVRGIAARYSEAPRVSKKDAVTAVMKVAAAIGLPAGAQALLNALFGVSDPQDWQDPNSHPIVWPSNERLCQQLGFSLPTLRRTIRTLVAAGLVLPHDSPNGKRWGRRNAAGQIVEAYGFDLAPMAVRCWELQELAARMESQRSLVAELRREATILRRRIEMAIDAGQEAGLLGDWAGFADALRHLVARYPRTPSSKELEPEISRLRRLTTELRHLVDLVEDAFRAGLKDNKLTPKDVISDTHILTTTQTKSTYLCSKNRRRSNERQVSQLRAASGGAFEEKPENLSADAQALEPGSTHMVSIELVATACPEILNYAPAPLRTWCDLVSLASQVRPWLGISPDAWEGARKTLGDSAAAVAVAVILQKETRAEIRSAGGYLRGMIGKANAGELNLAKTLHGLASRRVQT